jgi:hypothetical protein
MILTTSCATYLPILPNKTINYLHNDRWLSPMPNNGYSAVVTVVAAKRPLCSPWWCFCVLFAGFVVVWRIQHTLWWITKSVCGPWHVCPGWIYFSLLQSVRLRKITGYSANIEICNVWNIFIAKRSVYCVHWSCCTLKFSWILVHKCNLSQGRNPN